jgi:serine/threonine protein kinase
VRAFAAGFFSCALSNVETTMLNAGTKLGPYEVVSALGAGGMGEVYRARDTRLDRTVAIKVLPESFAHNAEFRQRFEREARAISALQHPNICTLFDVGSQTGLEYLVLECLEGETLATRVQKGALPAEQVLKIGTEVARALAVAHRQGIIHRALKPANIMLTKTGAKLMDFGLAKPLAAASAATPPSFTATMSMPGSPVTMAGTIVGTVQYMAPEQIHGQEADARSDIFALGCVLYEMASGRRAFEGKSQLSVASAILEKEPESIRSVQPLTPRNLERVVLRCLRKDADERWQSAGDVAIELSEMGQDAENSSVTTPAAPPQWIRLAPWIVATMALLALAFVLIRPTNQVQPATLVQASLPPPDGTSYVMSWDEAGPPAISRDGKALAFVAIDKSGVQKIWVRNLSESMAMPLSGTDNAIYPFWSPNGSAIGFFANGKLRRISASGGPVINICDAARARGGSWGNDDNILFTPDIQSPIFRVKATSDATPQPITKIDLELHSTHRWPVLLPDGNRFLYFAANHAQPEGTARNGIYIGSIDGKENRFLMPSNSSAVLVPGYLLFVRDGALVAQGFDAKTLQLEGDPHLISDHVYRSLATWHEVVDSSDNGILVYAPGNSQDMSHLAWYDSSGKNLGDFATSDFDLDLRFSPDGQKIAHAVGRPNSKLFVYDVKTGSRQQLEFDDGFDTAPVWSPDGRTIAFSKRIKNRYFIYRKVADGSRASELIYESNENKMVTDWSPDGKFLLAQSRTATGRLAIFKVPLDGDHTPQPVLTGEHEYFDGHLSPDGHWLLYVSNGEGSNQIYVSSFPDLAGKWQVSAHGGDGGEAPHWQGDGKAIYFLTQGHSIMKADVSTTGGKFTIVGQRTVINAAAVAPLVFRRSFSYDVTPDGKRVLVNAQTESPDVLTLVVNWPELLKK